MKKFGKKLKLGQDLSTIEMPASFLSPFSTLQAIAEDPLQVLVACDRDFSPMFSPDMRTRFEAVVAYFVDISSQRSEDKPKGSLPSHFLMRNLRKPINSVIGETHRVHCGGCTITAEQLSHHPPTCASHMHNEELGMSSVLVCTPKPVFQGTSVHIKMMGTLTVVLRLPNGMGEEEWKIGLPDIYMRLVGVEGPYTETNAQTSITCLRTDDTGAREEFEAALTFKGRGSMGRSVNRNRMILVLKKRAKGSRGEFQQYNKVAGRWDRQLVNESGEVWWTVKPKKPLSSVPAVVLDPVDQSTESWAIWGGLSDALLSGETKKASRWKKGVEQAQRALHKTMKEAGTKWQPRFFVQRADGHWDRRQTPLKLSPMWTESIERALFKQG